MRCLVISLLAGMLGLSAQAATIEARLVRATNAPGKPDSRLASLQPKLQKVFGYRNYQHLGAQTRTLKQGDKLRMNLGEGFVVFCAPKSVAKKTHEMDVELTSGKVSIVKNTMKIAEKSSVFIKGPEVGSDLIIVVLTVRE
jgi:hypothetical protein